MLKKDDYKYFLDQIYGLIIIDKEKKIVFMSKNFADHIHVDQDQVIGKSIKEVFPPTKMDISLEKAEPEIGDFYFIDGQAIASTRIPLRKDGCLVGLMEYDLFQKTEMLEQFVENYINLDDELKYFKEEVRNFRSAKYSIENIIGKSEAIQNLKQQIRYAARTDSTVVIEGETGSGKELVAHSIHNLSRRSLRNFIKMNAAAIPKDLFESELFGYEESAFTGAKKGGKKGKFELANKGTLFIDEINQMPYILQPKLLRVLQEKEIDKIGGKHSIPIDVRIIVSTNEDLEQLVSEKKFREDLFYRLNVVKIQVPPLRERKEDIPELAMNIVKQLNNTMGKNVKMIDDKTIKKLKEYNWPGNVRELQNKIEQAMNFVEGEKLSIQHFNLEEKDKRNFHHLNKEEKDKQSIYEECYSYEKPIEEIKKKVEKEFILKTLEICDWNKTQAAKKLKISRPLLYQKMKRLKI